MIILLSGKKQSGKNTFGLMLAFLIEYKILNKNIEDSKQHYPISFKQWLNFNEYEKEYGDINETLNHIQLKSFARPLKLAIAGLCGINSELLEKESFKNQQTLFNDNGKLLIYRQLLITLGDFCRKIDVNIFAKLLVNNIYKGKNNNDTIIVTDWRYINEYEYFKINEINPITIRLNRKTENQIDHPTETELDTFDKFDYVLENNLSLEDLFTKADIISDELLKLI